MTAAQRKLAVLAMGIALFNPACSCNGVVVNPLGGEGKIVTEEPHRSVWRDLSGDRAFGEEANEL